MKISSRRKKVANCQQKVGKRKRKVCAYVASVCERVCATVCLNVIVFVRLCVGLSIKRHLLKFFWFLAGMPFVYLCWALWRLDLRGLSLPPPPSFLSILIEPNILCGRSASWTEQLALPARINVAKVYSAICFEKYSNALFTQKLH